MKPDTVLNLTSAIISAVFALFATSHLAYYLTSESALLDYNPKGTGIFLIISSLFFIAIFVYSFLIHKKKVKTNAKWIVFVFAFTVISSVAFAFMYKEPRTPC